MWPNHFELGERNRSPFPSPAPQGRVENGARDVGIAKQWFAVKVGLLPSCIRLRLDGHLRDLLMHGAEPRLALLLQFLGAGFHVIGIDCRGEVIRSRQRICHQHHDQHDGRPERHAGFLTVGHGAPGGGKFCHPPDTRLQYQPFAATNCEYR